jgi:Sulfotransferase family
MSHGWSGSTLLGNALGELDGAVHVGELRALWDEGLQEGGTCGCGLPLASCPRWSSVAERVLAECGETPASAAALNRTVARVRNTPALLRRRAIDVARWPELERYARLTASLYGTIRDVTGARLVVDTSKRAGNAAVLRLVPEVDVRFVHLVRDPRAVAWSWRKRAAAGHGPVSVARDWSSFNVLFEAIRARHGRGRSVRVRYEDLVRSPGRTLSQLAGFAGSGGTRLPLVDDRTLRLGPNHTVLGNPVRFRTGEVVLEEDREWEWRLPAGDRRLVTALTAPLLVRYGYGRRARPVLA